MAMADARAVDACLGGIASPDSAIASAAIGAARVFMRGPRSASIVDAITTVAIDEERRDDIRLTALRALMELERSTIEPLLERLAADPSARVRTAVAPTPAARGRRAAADPVEALARMLEELP